jgi:hypothetical protein
MHAMPPWAKNFSFVKKKKKKKKKLERATAKLRW